VAVELTMVNMNVAVLRHSMTGQRAGFVVMGALVGLVLAAGTIFVALSWPDLLPAVYAVWMLGWIFGPVFAGGGDETLRPEYFTLLGLRPRRLASGLLVAAFVGVAPVISLLALTGLAVFGVRQGVAAALVSVPALLLQLAMFVLLSRVAVALLGLALRSRVGAVGAGLTNGLILAFLGQIWVVFMALGQTAGVPPVVTTATRYLPSGWGTVAVEAAASADWPRALAALGGMALLVVLLLAAWAALLTRRAGASRAATRGRRPIRATTASGAVLAKELRTWSRDLVRTHQLTFAFAYGVSFAAVPLLLDWNGMLPWAGPIFVVMAAAMSANLYSGDGTALWLTLMTPGASDVRGRQHAWLLAVAPLAVVLTLSLAAVTGGPWPILLAILLALLGGGAGLVPLASVYALIPGTDPHRRGGNPLRSTEEDGAVTGMVYAVLALTALTAVPAAIATALLGWAGVAVGALTGVLCYWGFGLLAERRLLAEGPELLDMMRTGRRPAAKPGAGGRTRFEDMSRRQQIIAGICFTTGAIPLFPQGVLAGYLKVSESPTRSWFLALYLPPWLQWPTIVFMVVLGVAIYATGVIVSYRRKESPGVGRETVTSTEVV
jgi:ABC-2 type transport system permease protein